MTTFKSKTLTSGSILQTFDRDGLLSFMKSDPGFAAGVAVALVGSEDKQAMLVFAGQPLNEKLSSTLDDSVSLATVLVLPPYFDRRHAEKVCRDIMLAIAAKRDLTPSNAAEMEVDEVPYGDREIVADLTAEVLGSINEIMDRDLV